MENFEQTVNRIRNMMAYGLTVTEIRETLLKEGLSESFIFLAYCGAVVMNKPVTF